MFMDLGIGWETDADVALSEHWPAPAMMGWYPFAIVAYVV